MEHKKVEQKTIYRLDRSNPFILLGSSILKSNIMSSLSSWDLWFCSLHLHPIWIGKKIPSLHQIPLNLVFLLFKLLFSSNFFSFQKLYIYNFSFFILFKMIFYVAAIFDVPVWTKYVIEFLPSFLDLMLHIIANCLSFFVMFGIFSILDIFRVTLPSFIKIYFII